MKDFTIEFSNDSITVRTAHITCRPHKLKGYMWNIMEGVLKQIKCRGKNNVIEFYNTDYTGVSIGMMTTRGGGWVKTFIEY